MKFKRCLFLLAAAIVFSSSSGHVFAQSADLLSPAQTSSVRQEGVQHKVQLQLLVASNGPNLRTDVPPPLEGVVKELKATMPFKSYRLIATYVYNVADGSSLQVSDVTYAQFEPGGALAPKFYSFQLAGIKSDAGGDSVHISRLKFDFRQRIFIEAVAGQEGKPAAQRFDDVVNGISTELSLRAGVPAIVGTLTTGLSDGVLVLVVTVDKSDSR